MAKLVHVAVGVIVNSYGQIIIAKRADDVHQGGLWEFPGGKVEQGETVEQALSRELHEELGIKVSACQPLLQLTHDYGDKKVLLDTWWVLAFDGEPSAKEGQPLKAVAKHALKDYEFPAANAAIVEAVMAAPASATIGS